MTYLTNNKQLNTNIMKMKLLLTMLLFASLLNAQKINMSYDGAGNQIKRYWTLSRAAGASYKTPETLKESDFILENKISYYPNPVLEELYMNWKNDAEKWVVTIDVFNMNGQLMKTYADLNNKETATIVFQNYPEGFYSLILNYENGEKKTFKIIKK
jgi:Secretion system C-terminal sorting domain